MHGLYANTTALYIRDLNIWVYWYCGREKYWNKSPMDTEEWLYNIREHFKRKKMLTKTKQIYVLKIIKIFMPHIYVNTYIRKKLRWTRIMSVPRVSYKYLLLLGVPWSQRQSQSLSGIQQNFLWRNTWKNSQYTLKRYYL